MKKIFVLITMTIFIFTFATSGIAASQIKDISNHWAKSSIEKGIQEGFITGYPDGTFKPNKDVTVAEFVKLALSVAKYKATESGTWYTAWMDKALELDIVTPSMTANPTKPITRSEMAHVITRVIESTSHLMDEFVPVSIEHVETELHRDRPQSDFFSEYINSDYRQMKKYVITYGNGKKKEIINWNKGSSQARQDDELYKKYYKTHPLDHTRFKYIVQDISKLSATDQDNISKLFDWGLLVGNIDQYKNVTFNPAGKLSRAEAAVILNRILFADQREVLDETKLEINSSIVSGLSQELRDGAIFRSNQYKGVLLVKDTQAISKQTVNQIGTYMPYRGFEYSFVYMYPEVVVDNYLPQKVQFFDRKAYSVDKALLLYIHQNYREEFEKDINHFFDLLEQGKAFEVLKSYGEAKVMFFKSENRMIVTIYPWEESFKYHIEQYLGFAKRDLENNDMDRINLILKSDGTPEYQKIIYRSVLNQPSITIDQIFEKTKKAYDQKFF